MDRYSYRFPDPDASHGRHALKGLRPGERLVTVNEPYGQFTYVERAVPFVSRISTKRGRT